MIVTIGAFDGFHRGHAELLARARELARASGLDWGAVTFHPHPHTFLGEMGATLFTLRERELIRRVLEIPHVIILQFDHELQGLSPETFWARLRKTFDIDGVVMGRDLRFGRGRAGTADMLAALCREDGLLASVVDLLERDGIRCSSTAARRAILAGEAARAADVLGHPWLLWGRVVHGDGRGRSIGFPTANLALPEGKVRLADGVYAVAVLIDGQWRCGALSMGDDPTFPSVRETRMEVFVLDFDGDIYDTDMLMLSLDRLRPMIRFPDARALAEQIEQDVARCRRIYQREMESRPSLFTTFASCLADMEAPGPFSPKIWRLTE